MPSRSPWALNGAARDDRLAALRMSFNRATNYDPQAQYDAFVASARSLEIPVVDVQAALLDAGVGEDSYFRSNVHWRADGHLAAAHAVRDFLLEHGLVPN